jgi:CHASE2 domain/CHAT domain
MKSQSHIFNLKVQKIEQICLFDLSWGQGQRLTVQVNYPNALTQLYQDWRRAYLNFYQSEHMRGRAVGGGVMTIHVDWHAELVKAESRLMFEFHRWLRSAELYDIRSQIAQVSQQLLQENSATTEAVQVFLTCAPIELDRFPWEAWEIGTEFSTTGAIQIIRAPLNIAAETGASHNRQRQGRARILAILGDDTGLNFQTDREAVKSLFRVADVQFVGWQPEQTSAQVIQQITDAIIDERGWDVLFFAGHSNETAMTGGELGIAPGVSISISEIAPQLSTAKKRGLQVAIFNSCSGLNIAESLIDMGFGQVIVMREPIHNRVAQEFLVRFLQGLAKHQDVYESVMGARQFLRMDKSHTYPSSYLVPSLFCHPGSKLFRIPNKNWKQRLLKGLPNTWEAIAIAASLTLSVLTPVQDLLMDPRILAQSVYRNVTAQIPSEEVPPVALVEIDAESISRAKLPNTQLMPFNRSYIAKLVDSTVKLNASVITLDFIFDTPQKEPESGDKDLGKAIRRAVDNNKWLISGAILQDGKEFAGNEATGITNRDWSLKGYADADPYLVELPSINSDCRQVCPLAYLMSVVHKANQKKISALPKPQTNRVTNLRTQLFDVLNKKDNQPSDLAALLNLRSPFGLTPKIDFSIPPNQIYQKIPAWKLLENADVSKFPLMSQQVVLIAVGNDSRLGLASGEPDRSPAPSAMSYWTQQDRLTGGESLAYMTHHFLTHHLVIPIPDIWMVGIAVIFGKIIVIALSKKSNFTLEHQPQIIAAALGGVVIYGIAGLQLYISAGVLLPWFLPSSVFLAYVLPATRRKNHV